MEGTGDWKVPGTRGQECPRYVAQAFQPAGSGDFPVARPSPALNHTQFRTNPFRLAKPLCRGKIMPLKTGGKSVKLQG